MRIPDVDTQERAKKTVDEFVKYAGAIRDEHLADIDDWYAHYKVEHTDGKYQGRAQTAEPSSHENVETIAPRIFTIVTEGGELKFETEPVESEIDAAVTATINALVKSDMKVCGGRNKTIAGCREVTKYGTMVARTPWKQYTRTHNIPLYGEPRVKGVDANGKIILTQPFRGYEKEEYVYYEGVDFEIVDLKRVYLDPIEPDIERAQGIAYEDDVDLAELERHELKKGSVDRYAQDGTPVAIEMPLGHYFNLDKVKEKLDNVKKEGVGQSVTKPQDKDTPRPKVNIKTYWGFFDWDNDGVDENCIITLAQDEFIIQCEPSTYPLRPWILSRYIPIEGQTYGLGALQIMSNVQKVINDLQNQTIDGNTQNLLNMWLLEDDSEIEDKDLEFGQSKVFRVSNTETELVPLRPGNLTGLGWEGIAWLVEKLKSGTGASRALTAQPFGTNTTATEVQQNQVEASARIVLTAFVQEEEWIVPWLRRIVEYNREFMGPQKVLRISEKDAQGAQRLKSITEEDIAAQVDFTPLGATKYQRQQKARQELSEFLQQAAMVMGIPVQTAMQYNLNLDVLLREVASNYSSIADKATEMFGMPRNQLPALTGPPQGGNGAIGGEPAELADPGVTAEFLRGGI